MAGLRHVALHARHFDDMLAFYERIMGMRVEWRPDADNVYLTSGVDNLAIHRAAGAAASSGQQLDHIGFTVDRAADVDQWYDYLQSHGVAVRDARETTATARAVSTARTRKASLCRSSITSRWRGRRADELANLDVAVAYRRHLFRTERWHLIVPPLRAMLARLGGSET